MIKKFAHHLILLFILNVSCLFAETLQYERQIVTKIDIEMMNLTEGDTCDAASIIARIKTHEGHLFSQTDFDNDLKNLVQEFDHVEPVIDSFDNKLQILLKIWPKSTIRLITWEGNHKIDTKKLQKELSISSGSVFDRQAFNKAFHKLKTHYVKQGFFEASLNYEVDLDTETNSVDILISVHEGRAGRIQKIKLVNFTSDEEDGILTDMVTKKYSFLTSWYTEEGTYREDAMLQDRMSILNFLHNEGYADAKVDIEIYESQSNHRIIITITAIKGEIYYVGPTSFKGNTLFTDEEIERTFVFKEGDPYSPEDIRETIKRITDSYGRRGYIDAIVDYEPRLDCENRTYAVDFLIEEGDKYHVGLIKVFGNTTTDTKVILHETLLVPGEIFNIIKLKYTQDKLDNIGYFKHVNVYTVRSEGPGGLGEHYRDVHIEVEETTTGNFGAGFGMSTAESVFGEFKITERNFNHEGLLTCWSDGFSSLRGGGEFVSLTAMIGAKSRKYTFSWTKPFFRDTPWIVGFELQQSNNRYISKDYDINSAQVLVHGAYPLNQFLRFGTHYRLTNAYISLNKGEINREERKMRERFENLSGLTCKLREEARNMGLISAIGVNLNYDSTDSPSFPHRGFKSRLEQEIAGFGGDHAFMGFAYLNSYYVPAGPKGVFRFKADMRFIVPLFDTKRFHIPIDERLFLGGDNAIRGYKYYRLGPQYNEGDPRGGMSMQILSAQFSYILGKRVNAFVFCDSGHLSFDVWNFGTMWTSIGFGVNLQVLESAPPVVLGLGFPLNPDRPSDVKRFFFNLGGSF